MSLADIEQAVNRLELSEKLLLVEELWDSIALDNQDLPIPVWQKQELDKRYREFQRGHVALHDWQAVHRALRAGTQ